MGLEYEHSSEPLHISVKPYTLTNETLEDSPPKPLCLWMSLPPTPSPQNTYLLKAMHFGIFIVQIPAQPDFDTKMGL